MASSSRLARSDALFAPRCDSWIVNPKVASNPINEDRPKNFRASRVLAAFAYSTRPTTLGAETTIFTVLAGMARIVAVAGCEELMRNKLRQVRGGEQEREQEG